MVYSRLHVVIDDNKLADTIFGPYTTFHQRTSTNRISNMAIGPPDKIMGLRDTFHKMLQGEEWLELVRQGDNSIEPNSSNSAMESMLEGSRTMQRSIPSLDGIAACNPSYDELLHWLYREAYLRCIEPGNETVASFDVDAAWEAKLTKWRSFWTTSPLATIRQHFSVDDLVRRVVEMCTDIREIRDSTL